eukprot:TRINITY_DN2059_c0_g1_i1.p1 TRINITY_DN2059_c0_g1~~TRINITY_DN2059_c0_g1_i1.p1  ORF type:complete len:177 (+),score=38.42 TRINITY_DN2059_c0_g1_i1:58-588(+)
MGNKHGSLLSSGSGARTRISPSSYVDLEVGWNEKIGSRKNQADLAQFRELMPSDIPAANLASLFALYDHNHNGKLSWHEYLCTVTLLMSGSFEEKIDLIFHAFDKDGNGSISEKELKEAVRKFARPGDDSKMFIHQVMQTCDVDKDGTISLEEFQNFVKENPDVYEKMSGRLNVAL